MITLAKLADKIIYKEAIKRLKTFFKQSGKEIEYGQVIFNFHQGRCVHIDYKASSRLTAEKLLGV